MYGVLAGDATLHALVADRIYSEVAPADATFPVVVFQWMSGHDVRGVGPTRIMDDLLYLVKAIGQTKAFTDIETIANRVDVLLHAQSGAPTGGTVYGCVREEPFKLAEDDEGISYRHLGGSYRLWVI